MSNVSAYILTSTHNTMKQYIICMENYVTMCVLTIATEVPVLQSDRYIGGSAKLPLLLIKRHSMKTCGTGSIDPRIINLRNK
jgi:hypothetical protein